MKIGPSRDQLSELGEVGCWALVMSHRMGDTESIVERPGERETVLNDFYEFAYQLRFIHPIGLPFQWYHGECIHTTIFIMTPSLGHA